MAIAPLAPLGKRRSRIASKSAPSTRLLGPLLVSQKPSLAPDAKTPRAVYLALARRRAVTKSRFWFPGARFQLYEAEIPAPYLLPIRNITKT